MTVIGMQIVLTRLVHSRAPVGWDSGAMADNVTVCVCWGGGGWEVAGVCMCVSGCVCVWVCAWWVCG